jgi:uncharacterized Ntn-hydrolase superfamily protein
MKTIKIKLTDKHHAQLRSAARSWGYKKLGNYVSVQVFRQMKRAESAG